MKKTVLLVATQRIMLELARFLIRNSVSHKEFLEVSRWAFTKAGTEVLQENGQVTIGSLSDITGQSRKEISRAEAYPDIQSQDADLIWRRAIRVLHKWHTKSEYVDHKGSPRELDLRNTEIFRSLFDVADELDSAKQIFSALLEAGSVVEVSKSAWRPVNRYYIPKDRSLIFNYFGQAVSRLIATLNHNINDRQKEPWVERMVSTADLKSSAVPLFCRVGKEQAQKFLESLDDWMSSNETDENSLDDQGPIEIGLGLYYFEIK